MVTTPTVFPYWIDFPQPLSAEEEYAPITNEGNRRLQNSFSSIKSTMLSASFRSARLLVKRTARLSRGASPVQCCWASTLVLSDPLTADGAIPPATQSAVTAASQLGGDSIELLVVGESAPSKIPAGVSKVYHATAAKPVAETVASTLQAAASNNSYDYVMGTSSKFGATVVPRAAALLGASPITDIIEIVGPGTTL
jgi:hypothetical protein